MLNESYILPFDTLNIILQYDGRIKYIHKDNIYVNIISKNDYRYKLITLIMIDKIELLEKFNDSNNRQKFFVDICYYINGLHFLRNYIF